MSATARILAFLLLVLLSITGRVQAQLITSLVAGQATAKPASSNIAEASAADAVLQQALSEAGLLPVLSGKGPYTFFAPTDEALQGWTVTDPEIRRQKLLGHVVQGRYAMADLYDGARLSALNGELLTVLRKKGKVLVNGVSVTNGDMSSGNGITHAVSGLLNP